MLGSLELGGGVATDSALGFCALGTGLGVVSAGVGSGAFAAAFSTGGVDAGAGSDDSCFCSETES